MIHDLGFSKLGGFKKKQLMSVSPNPGSGSYEGTFGLLHEEKRKAKREGEGTEISQKSSVSDKKRKILK